MSIDTPELLVKEGFVYEASLMGDDIPYTGDQKYELVIPSAVQRFFFPDQVQDAPQTRVLVFRTGARAANKIPEPRRTMKNAAAHPG